MKVLKFAPLVLVLLAIACGSVIIELNTEVIGEDNIKHNFTFETEGFFASTFMSEIGLDDLPEGCTGSENAASVIMTCVDFHESEVQGFFQAFAEAKAEHFGEPRPIGPFGVRVARKDLGSQWEYRAALDNMFYGYMDAIMAELPEEDRAMMEGEDLSSAMDAIARMRLYWSVTMPGEIVSGNSDRLNDNEAIFRVGLDDSRGELYVVSRVDKPGACNR